MDTQTVPYQPRGALAWGSTVWWCFKNKFLSCIPSSNLFNSHNVPIDTGKFKLQKAMLSLC